MFNGSAAAPRRYFISLNTLLYCRTVITVILTLVLPHFPWFIAFITLLPSLFYIFFVFFYIVMYFLSFSRFTVCIPLLCLCSCNLFYFYFPPHLFSAIVPFARSKTSRKASPHDKISRQDLHGTSQVKPHVHLHNVHHIAVSFYVSGPRDMVFPSLFHDRVPPISNVNHDKAN